MKYAVIAISGSQFKITENQVITVDLQELEAGKKTTTDQVLLFVDDKITKVGTPTIKGAVVEYEVVKSFQGKKLDILTYKAKSRYRRHTGFRAQLTDIKILKINN
ncbi:MAG: 50S ribosomal protein L21 [Candidatus Shapirobacteria bacterium]|nr:50S ribosomal protein L21 [Candidatus Shapirobacteria bacterium]